MSSASNSQTGNATAALPKLLAINFFPNFFPPTSGGEQRSFHILDAMSRHYRVVSITPTYLGTRDEIVKYSETFQEHRFTKTRVYQRWHQELKSLGLNSSGADMALSLAVKSHGALLAGIERHWSEADVIVLQHPCCLPAISHLDLHNKRLVYLSHNCEFELAAQKLAEGPGHDYLMLMAQLEYRLCQQADHIAVVSSEDGTKMRGLYGLPKSKIAVIGNGSVSRFGSTDETAQDFGATDAKSALFVGSEWPPNVEAAQYIASVLAPQLGDVTFHIAGSVCRALDGAALLPNVQLHYVLDDAELGALMRQTHIGLNPMSSGGGSNVKIADYLAHGLRIVTTPIGARGFPTNLANSHVATLAAMPEALVPLVANAPTAVERSEWRKSARDLWHWPTLAKPLLASLNEPLPDAGSEKKLVVLNEFPVRGSNNGGEARVTGLYQSTQDLTVILSFGREGFRSQVLGENLMGIELPLTVSQFEAAKDANRATYSSVNDIVFPARAHENPLWLEMADMILANADGLVFSHPFMLPVYELLVTRRRFVHDSHNVEALLKHEALETHKHQEDFVREVERQEKAMIAQAKLIAACSPSDQAYFQAHGAKNVILAENGVDITSARSPSMAEALAAEPEFSSRNVYLFEEFTALPEREFAVAACRAVLKRPMTGPEESQLASRNFADSKARAQFLVELISSPDNSKRVLVVGARRAAGLPEKTAVFIGSGHRPNLTAAEFLVSIVAPKIPDIQVLIIGQIGASMNRATFGANVFATGFVSAAMKSYLMSNATVGLNPMIGGGGSNLKVPDYIAHGLPVVTSEFGQRGFALGPQEGMYSAPLAGFASRVQDVVARFEHNKFDPSRALAIIKDRYDWTKISQRFLAATHEALFDGDTGDVTVICEDSSMLGANVYSTASQLIANVAETGRLKELIVQCRRQPHECIRDWQTQVPSSIETVTRATIDREWTFHSAGQLQQDNILWNELDVVTTSAQPKEIVAACENAEFLKPTILSGAGNVFAADAPWRFMTNDWIVALPSESRALLLRGKAHEGYIVTVVGLESGSRTNHPVRGNFNLRCLVQDSVVRIQTRPIDPDVAKSNESIHLQMNRVAVETEAFELESNPWINSAEALHQLGLPADRKCYINGRTAPVVSQELQILINKRAPAGGTMLVVGGADFTARVRDLVAGQCAVVEFDGEKLQREGEAAPAELIFPILDAELGLARNRMEQSYLSGQMIKMGAILIFAERVNGEVIRFASNLKKQLPPGFLDGQVAIVCPEGNVPAQTGNSGQALLDQVPVLCPTSSKAQLALLGMARLVIVRDDVLRFGRIPTLLKLLATRGLVWRSGQAHATNVFAQMPSIACVDEVVELLWRAPLESAPSFTLPASPADQIEAMLGPRPGTPAVQDDEKVDDDRSAAAV